MMILATCLVNPDISLTKVVEEEVGSVVAIQANHGDSIQMACISSFIFTLKACLLADLLTGKAVVSTFGKQ